MIDREINERIAGALGWVLCEHIQAYRPWYGARDCDFVPVRDFSPATSVDALRKWVLPEVERRGLAESLMIRLAADDDRAVLMGAREPARNSGHYMFRLLTMEPSVLAAAALAVLEEDNDVN